MNRQYGYEEFHTVTKNSAAFKHVLTAHKLHYDPRIAQLQRDAPLRIAAERLQLAPLLEPPTALEGVIRTRRSSRSFAPESVPAEHFAKLLFHANGVQQGFHPDLAYKRTVPNSGNLGSVEIFPVVFDVEGIEPGLYHYDSLSHELVVLRSGCLKAQFREHVLFQPEYTDAGVLFLLTSAIGRLAEKYGPRGYRLGLLDVGHVSQNLNLMATGLGLNVCPTAGFIDDVLEEMLGIDGLTRCIFLLVAVGK